MHRDFAEWYSAGGRIANRLPIRDIPTRRDQSALRWRCQDAPSGSDPYAAPTRTHIYHQANSKLQTPNSRETPSFKVQGPGRGLGACRFPGAWSLVIEAFPLGPQLILTPTGEILGHSSMRHRGKKPRLTPIAKIASP